MVEVVAVDNLVMRVSDYERSRAFYADRFAFMGFEIIDRYEDMTGWRKGRTAYWIARAAPGARPYRAGEVGFAHYAFEVGGRGDVDALQAYLRKTGASIVDPAGVYYEDYYAVYFTDPDGLKLEAMTYGSGHQDAARQK